MLEERLVEIGSELQARHDRAQRHKMGWRGTGSRGKLNDGRACRLWQPQGMYSGKRSSKRESENAPRTLVNLCTASSELL